MDKSSQYRKKHIIDAIKSAILMFLIVFTNIHLSTVNQAVAAENVNKEIESSVPSDYSNVKSIGVDVFGSCKQVLSILMNRDIRWLYIKINCI